MLFEWGCDLAVMINDENFCTTSRSIKRAELPRVVVWWMRYYNAATLVFVYRASINFITISQQRERINATRQLRTIARKDEYNRYCATTPYKNLRRFLPDFIFIDCVTTLWRILSTETTFLREKNSIRIIFQFDRWGKSGFLAFFFLNCSSFYRFDVPKVFFDETICSPFM